MRGYKSFYSGHIGSPRRGSRAFEVTVQIKALLGNRERCNMYRRVGSGGTG